jgi:glycosyltransferase involved in cell wall biosynthesis
MERKVGLWCIRRADQIVSPSQAMLDAVQEETGMKFPGAVVKPYPLDPRLLEITSAESSSGRQNTAKTIFFAARNDPVKGGDVLIHAIPLILQKYPDTKFHFFGYEPSSKQSSSVGDTVFFHSFIPREQLLKEYVKSDICVIPSFWDNSPNTIYEAMASAKPVVVANAGGMPELVIEYETGLLFSPGSSEQLAEAIKFLLANPSKIPTMGQAARRRILSLSELSKDVDQRVELYQKVLTRRSHP